MTDTRPKIEIDKRLVNETFLSLENALKAAQRNPDGHTTITMPAVAIDGLLGMVRGPDDGDFWYRRRQFIVFYGMFAARRKPKPRLD